MPAAPKTPTDHKKKAVEQRFVFRYKGTDYPSKPIRDCIDPGWVRKNRHLDPSDYFMSLFEVIFDEKTLDFLDSDWDVMNAAVVQVQEFFKDQVGATPGE